MISYHSNFIEFKADMTARLALLATFFITFCIPAFALSDIAPEQPLIGAASFSLADFGAVPDGKTPNTEAFRRAIAAGDKAKGGTLLVPAGRWLTGPVDLCSGLNLRVEEGATIFFESKASLYEVSGRKFRPLLRASNIHDLIISGAGTIDGHGEAWWGEALKFKADARAKGAKNDTNPRPNLVGFEHCLRVRLEGITLTNSPKFNFVPNLCEDVTVDGITIYNPADSPNTDGIDPSLTRRMLIAHCRIDTGDDCIAIKSGGVAGEGVHNLLITDCTFLHGHGCSFGSETSGSVRNVTVRHCTFEGTDIGVRFKSDRSRGGIVENILYTDLVMKNVGQAIVITSYYPERSMPKMGEKVQKESVTDTTPIWRNITVRNLTAAACTKTAGVIIGLPEAPVSDVTLENVSIDAPVGLRFAYAKDITLRGVKITADTGPPLLVEDTVVGLKESK